MCLQCLDMVWQSDDLRESPKSNGDLIRSPDEFNQSVQMPRNGDYSSDNSSIHKPNPKRMIYQSDYYFMLYTIANRLHQSNQLQDHPRLTTSRQVRRSHQKNLQYITNRKKNAMIPIGPYCRHIAIKLICLACLLYFALSSRRLLLRVLIPEISLFQAS